MRFAKFLTVALVLTATAMQAQRPALSNKPDTPFKLATFEAQGKTRIGLTSGNRLVDIQAANTYVAQKAGLPAMTMNSSSSFSFFSIFLSCSM